MKPCHAEGRLREIGGAGAGVGLGWGGWGLVMISMIPV